MPLATEARGAVYAGWGRAATPVAFSTRRMMPGGLICDGSGILIVGFCSTRGR